jgi:LPXTG-motif cell wall-anchored protein
LNKENWHQANKSGETDGKGHWQTSFKTEGDFGIMVVPKTKPAKYTLVTWMGKEAKEVGVSSPFSDKAPGADGGFFKKNLLYIVIGAVVLLGILFFVLKRKKTIA